MEKKTDKEHGPAREHAIFRNSYTATFCQSKKEKCFQYALGGYQFCMIHILEDPSAPYKQCDFVMPSSGEQCVFAVSLSTPDIRFCHIHSWKEMTDANLEDYIKKYASSHGSMSTLLLSVIAAHHGSQFFENPDILSPLRTVSENDCRRKNLVQNGSLCSPRAFSEDIFLNGGHEDIDSCSWHALNGKQPVKACLTKRSRQDIAATNNVREIGRKLIKHEAFLHPDHNLALPNHTSKLKCKSSKCTHMTFSDRNQQINSHRKLLKSKNFERTVYSISPRVERRGNASSIKESLFHAAMSDKGKTLSDSMVMPANNALIRPRKRFFMPNLYFDIGQIDSTRTGLKWTPNMLRPGIAKYGLTDHVNELHLISATHLTDSEFMGKELNYGRKKSVRMGTGKKERHMCHFKDPNPLMKHKRLPILRNFSSGKQCSSENDAELHQLGEKNFELSFGSEAEIVYASDKAGRRFTEAGIVDNIFKSKVTPLCHGRIPSIEDASDLDLSHNSSDSSSYCGSRFSSFSKNFSVSVDHELKMPMLTPAKLERTTCQDSNICEGVHVHGPSTGGKFTRMYEKTQKPCKGAEFAISTASISTVQAKLEENKKMSLSNGGNARHTLTEAAKLKCISNTTDNTDCLDGQVMGEPGLKNETDSVSRVGAGDCLASRPFQSKKVADEGLFSCKPTQTLGNDKPKQNFSGIRKKSSGRFEATLYDRNLKKKIYVGVFDSMIEAAHARRQKAIALAASSAANSLGSHARQISSSQFADKNGNGVSQNKIKKRKPDLRNLPFGKRSKVEYDSHRGPHGVLQFEEQKSKGDKLLTSNASLADDEHIKKQRTIDVHISSEKQEKDAASVYSKTPEAQRSQNHKKSGIRSSNIHKHDIVFGFDDLYIESEYTRVYRTTSKRRALQNRCAHGNADLQNDVEKVPLHTDTNRDPGKLNAESEIHIAENNEQEIYQSLSDDGPR